MMIKYGPYILMGLIGVLAIGLAAFIGYMIYCEQRDKKARELKKVAPREDSLADKIKDQFKVVDKERERRIYTSKGMVSVKPTRSAFSFAEPDPAEKGISLESPFEKRAQAPFVNPDENI